MPNLVGGLSPQEKEADEHIQEILNKVKPELESKLGKFDKLEAESYRSQIVNGTNFFIKIHTGDENSRLHIRVHKPIRGEPILISHQPDRKPMDPISYF